MNRTDTLKMYLAQLAADTAAQGKFAGAGSDKAQAVAHAILNGSAHMLEALLSDVKIVAGDGHSFATAAVASLASRAVEQGIRAGMGKLGEAISVALDKDRREKRKAGRAFMDAAKGMGR